MPAKRRSHTSPNPSTDEIVQRADEVLQRAIVLQLLRQDRDERWSRAELETELQETPPIEVNDALAHLREEGVLHLSGELVRASRASRHIDNLGMIAI